MNPKIQQISDIISEIENKIGDVDSNMTANAQTGFLDGREIKEVTKCILSDIRRLTKSNHLSFYFSSQEIDQIFNALNQIKAHAPQSLQHVVNNLSIIRPLVRSYWIRSRNQLETDQLHACEEALTDLHDVISIKDEIQEQAQTLKEELESTKKTLLTLKDEISDLQSLKSTANQNAIEITNFKSLAESETATVKAKRETIDGFTEKITSREKDLESLKKITTDFSEDLKKLKSIHLEKKNELRGLIEDAQTALNLNTSIGLSKEFQAKADSLKPKFGFSFTNERWFFLPKLKSENLMGFWLIASSFLVLIAITIGLVLIAGKIEIFSQTITFQQGEWYQVLSKLSIIGLLVTAAVFCAKQYTRNSRIMEEYAYRKVVSASLPSFLKQLEGFSDDNTLESKYLIKAIDTLHKHPLSFLDNQQGLPISLRTLGEGQEKLIKKVEELVKY